MVNLRLIQPQEIEVLYVLPAIRRQLTIEMKKSGKSQKEIAELLCVTESAVSQYLKSKRAAKLKFKKEMLDDIKNSANKIKNVKSMLFETQKLLRKIEKSGFLCEVHRSLSVLPSNCAECFK
ncbi:MAG: helix-turn-helix domain-containing protein [archaeon]